MNLDNHTSSSTLTLLPLGGSVFIAPSLSFGLIEMMNKTLAEDKKILLFYNRRGNARAWVCQDCGHFQKCPDCDIAFAYHTTPRKQLICHQCNRIEPFPLECPACHGNHLTGVGVGIQQIEASLRTIYPHFSEKEILRIDSDKPIQPKNISGFLQDARIILATESASTLLHEKVGIVGFILFELNLSLPQYDGEEEIHTQITYYKKHSFPIVLQTYIPDHPLLQNLLFSNTKTFMESLQKERKDFLYPPFSQFATLKIHHPSKEKVSHFVSHLIHKINLIKTPTTYIVFDTTIFERHHGEWVQKIILKDTITLSPLLENLEIEIVRNRSVTLEWNSL